MHRKTRLSLAAGTGVALAVAGGGAALAATKETPAQARPAEQSRAIIDDAAKELGVDAAKLREAFEQALENRVDEAVAAGRLTEEQGAELKARIGSAGFPLLGLRGGHGGRHGHDGGARLETAASFLGLTEAELREQLRAGKTLADVAQSSGQTVAGLVQALVAAETAKLAEAVESGRLTDVQRDRMLEALEERVTERVNGTEPRRERGPRFRGAPHTTPPGSEPRHRFGGGPSSSTEPPAAA